MTTLVFDRPNGLRGGRPLRAKLLRGVKTLFSGIQEGRRLRFEYDSLTRKSDVELSRLGIRREDIPHVVVFGKAQ